MRELFIRADATSEIGTGHVMRTIALAQAWIDEGGSVTFIGYYGNSAIENRIEQEGCNVSKFDGFLTGSKDLERTLKTLKDLTGDNEEDRFNESWILLDGYHFSEDYQVKLKEKYYLLIIDDYNHLKKYTGDLLLNQNLTAMSYKYNSDNETKLLLGTKYSLLRREFLDSNDIKPQDKDNVTKILVTMGGSDPEGVIIKVLQTLKMIKNHSFEVKIILGPVDNNTEDVKAVINNVFFQVNIYHQVKDMNSLMTWADIAISGGGSTTLELLYMGIPCCSIILAENQSEIVHSLEKMGVGINLGWYNAIVPGITSKKIEALLENQILISQMSTKCLKLVDGRGALRVVYEMHCYDLPLRAANKEDMRIIWDMANDEDVRNFSFSSEKITWDRHKKWFTERINDRNSYIFLALSLDKSSIGQIRFNVKNNEAEIDVSVNHNKRGIGLGKEIIKAGINKFMSLRPEIRPVAYIKSNNLASVKAFMGAGFFKKEEVYTKGYQCHRMELKQDINKGSYEKHEK